MCHVSLCVRVTCILMTTINFTTVILNIYTRSHLKDTNVGYTLDHSNSNFIQPNILQGNTYNVGDFKDQVVRVRNIGADDSEGVISVFVSGLTAFDVVFDPNMTVANILIGTTTVNNQDWTTTVLAGGVLYTSSVVIPAGSESKIGLSTEALVAGQDGNLNISILNNSGGDNDNTNNTANKFLVISLN